MRNKNNKIWNLKKYLILFICLILFYTIFITAAVTASEPATLRAGVYENPPKIFTDDKGNISGFWPDIINYIASQEGWEIEWVWGTWPQCLERLENKEIEIMPDVSFTEPRSKKYAFTQETILASWSRIYTRRGVRIESILDLEGKKIAVMTGSANFTGLGGIKELIRKFDLNCTFIEMNNYAEVFEALGKGEVDAGVTNKDFGNKHEKDFNIERTPIIFRPSHIQFAFPKDSSLTLHLLERIDYHMKELKENNDSIYYQSLEKWLTVKVGEKQVIPGWVYYVLIGVGGLAFLLFGGNYLLRSQVRSKTKELRKDITQRKKAEKNLKNIKDELQMILDSVPALIFYKDIEGRIIRANKTLANSLKMPVKDIVGKTTEELFPKEQAKKMRKDDREVIVSGKPKRNIIQPYTTPDGIRWLITDKIPYKDKEGKVTGVIGLAKDITAQRISEQKLQLTYQKLKKTMDATINTMSRMIEAKDPYTAGHQQRVSQLATTIAKELNLSPDKIEGIRIASLIHDIGKIGLPTEILSKPTRLTDIEFSLIKNHSQIGYDILKSIDFSYPIANIVLQHHERLNGSGYPNKLKGDKILLEAKIICVADVVEAMSSHRPYRPALGIDAALEEISQNKGFFYDPKVVDACLKLFKEKGFKFE